MHLPPDGAFSSAQDRSRMERLINKLKRSGFLPELVPSAGWRSRPVPV